MKREILFRGQVKYNGNHLFAGQFVYGSLIIKSTTWTFIHVIEEDEFGNIVREFEVEVIPETVGQFTGLLDKNGNRIFEGDVIEGKSYLYGHQLAPDGKQFDYKGVVEFQMQCDVGLCWVVSDGKGSWNLNKTVHRNTIDFCTGSIISNIHDDPDILK